MKELLRFEEGSIKGQKTKRFYVYSNHSDDLLGIIKWKPSWRCYVMSYEDDIEMSLSCNKELDIFMENLEKKRISDKNKLYTKEKLNESVTFDRN